MSRGRTPRRLTGWLALFALALQFAVAFDHVHREDFAGLLTAGVARAAATDQAPAGDPGHNHLTCDICATVHLAGTLLVPAPPPLALPSSSAAARTISTPQIHTAARPSAFHARGPPQA